MSNASDLPRYTHQPLPPYSYVSGMFPHPTRDSQGHSYGEQEQIVQPPSATDWQECAHYLRGIDLFNHGYYWEAHERWEAVWRGAEPQSVASDFFKGLIKLAAAGVKAREGRAAGVARHARRCVELLQSVRDQLDAQEEIFLGLRLAPLIEHARAIETAPQEYVNRDAANVVVVFPFRLAPHSNS